MSIEYKHIKTGNMYSKIGEALDCTNSRGGHAANRIMVIYKSSKSETVFVRDKDEFERNFIKQDCK
jgi:hypothetical protein